MTYSEASAPPARPHDIASWLRETATKLGWNQVERDKLTQAADEIERLWEVETLTTKDLLAQARKDAGAVGKWLGATDAPHDVIAAQERVHAALKGASGCSWCGGDGYTESFNADQTDVVITLCPYCQRGEA